MWVELKRQPLHGCVLRVSKPKPQSILQFYRSLVEVSMIPVCIQCNQERIEKQGSEKCVCVCVSVCACGVRMGWIETAVLTLILCVVLFGLLRFGFLWTVSRDYKACFSSAFLWGRREGPCKAPWLDFSADLVDLRCKQDIKDRGDGELMSLCVSVHTAKGCLCGFILCILHRGVTRPVKKRN